MNRRVGVRARLGGAAVIVAAALALVAASGLPASAAPETAPADATAATLERVARQAMDTYHLKALIVRVTQDGREVYTDALGESMTGVPATTDMHFRNGAFAFTYIGQTFARLADEKKLSLDDPLSTWLPELPRSRQITVRQLLNMTSGYADYVYLPRVGRAVQRNPFRQWNSDQLIRLGVTAPMDFAPGTNWGYSHTNYVILGRVLEKITGKSTAEVLQDYVLGPMGLTGTSSNGNTPAVPEPVLHTFTSERRGYLEVPRRLPFYEEATFWNPSWTTAPGAVMTSTIRDVTTSMEIVGSGSQVSPDMYQQQVGQNLVGFGKKDPTGACQSCRPNTTAFSYGLGVVLLGPWITQTMNFAGQGATSGYLPSEKLTISVAVTYLPTAFDRDGVYANSSALIFGEFGDALAPGTLPPRPPS